MRGVRTLMMDDGAIRFVSDRVAATAVTETTGGRFTASEPSLQIDRPWVVDAEGKRSESAAQWSIVEEKDQPVRIRLTINAKGLAYPIVVDPSFSVNGSMFAQRRQHTATLLSNGKVLIIGGFNGNYLNTPELYNPATGQVTTTGVMSAPRAHHSATRLQNGKVLVTGGQTTGGAILNTAELYDPVTGTFTTTATTMTSPRKLHTVTLLPSGKALISGGDNSGALAMAEVYDPATGMFIATNNSMMAPRADHTATLLPNGKVVIVGGYSTSFLFLNSAELYVPADNRFESTGGMTSVRSNHTATLLPNGRVLVAGGYGQGTAILNTATLYDPASNGFLAVNGIMGARADHRATLLPDGTVLLTGGIINISSNAATNNAQLYLQNTEAFVGTAEMTTSRGFHTATLLPNGKVLIAGGSTGSSYQSSTELYDSASPAYTVTGNMTVKRDHHTATLLSNGKVLIAGGIAAPDQGIQVFNPFRPRSGEVTMSLAELYDPALSAFSSTTGMTGVRHSHTATLLPNGKVLIAGGSNGAGSLNTTELYNPAALNFTATGPMNQLRANHTATLLPNGRVLVVGGENSTVLSSAEIYDPGNETFSLTGSLPDARSNHTATLLPNGNVLIAGGRSSTDVNASVAYANSAYLYDVATGTFAATGSMGVVRAYHTATVLPSGRILIAGGYNGSAYTNTAELYDPAGFFAPTAGAMTVNRWSDAATLLPDGRVLFSGSLVSDFYDSFTRTFTYVNNTGPRVNHTATMLSNGRVLIAGGLDITDGGSQITAEYYDVGLGISDARRPVVSTLTNPLCQPASLALSGSLFTGDSEGSSGASSSSPTNAPLLRLQRVDNEQPFLSLSESFSAGSFLSATLDNLSSGRYRVAIMSNAIPSIDAIIEVATTPLLGMYGSGSASQGGSTTVTPILPSGYNGLFYPLAVSAASGFTGSLGINAGTGAVTIVDAGPAGSHTITVSSTTSCGSAATTFPLDVGIPTNVVATATTSTSVLITWSATIAESYEVLRLSAGGVSQTLGSTIATSTSASFNDNNAAPNTAYLYRVRSTTSSVSPYSRPDLATTVIFTDPTLIAGSTNIKAAHFTQLRTAANAVRALAGLAAFSFTDTPITPGVTPIKAVHLTELRTALNAARGSLLLPAINYATPTVGAGNTTIAAIHIEDLRSGVK